MWINVCLSRKKKRVLLVNFFFARLSTSIAVVGGPEKHLLNRCTAPSYWAIDTTHQSGPPSIERESIDCRVQSNVAAFLLGSGFFGGIWGLPKDQVRARYWIKKVVDRECEHKHLHSSNIAEAARLLRILDEQADALRSLEE